ncbi:uncharacterized protein LOC144142474 isoform X2 [Haemaphysalis longicornis]
MFSSAYSMSPEAWEMFLAYIRPRWPPMTVYTLECMYRQQQQQRPHYPQLQERPRLGGEYHTIVRQMLIENGPALFCYFGMNRERFSHLLELVRPLIHRQREAANTITGAEKLAFTLRLLAHGLSIRGLATSYQISPSVARHNFKATCLALRQVLEPLYLDPLNTEDSWRKSANHFETKLHFPHCVGAIVGRKIHASAQSTNGYQDFGTLLFAVCDSEYRFALVDIAEFQSGDTEGLFRNSSIARKLTGKQLALPPARKMGGSPTALPYFIAGDSTFPSFENLVVPYPEASLDSERKRNFNDRLSRALRIADNAFGILASRWLILSKKTMASPESTTTIVWATVLLHNCLRTLDVIRGSNYCSTGDVDRVTEDGRIIPGLWRSKEGLGTGFTAVTTC